MSTGRMPRVFSQPSCALRKERVGYIRRCLCKVTLRAIDAVISRVVHERKIKIKCRWKAYIDLFCLRRIGSLRREPLESRDKLFNSSHSGLQKVAR